MITRRGFIRNSAVVAAGIGAAPLWLVRAAAAPAAKRKTLVVLFLRGAADGLNIIVPYSEQDYYTLRPSIAVPRPGVANGAIDLDGRFGLNPTMRTLKGLWDRQQLALIPATGSADSSRSHFDAQEFMECGTTSSKLDTGWLNRVLGPAAKGASPVRAITAGLKMPRTLTGSCAAVALGEMDQFRFDDPQQARAIERIYSMSRDAQLASASAELFAQVKQFEEFVGSSYSPAPGAQYAPTGPGKSLQQIARLIKADLGVEAAFTDVPGWDHHQEEPNLMTPVLTQLSAGLNAFCTDMGDRMEDIVIVTMSEFGRTAKENGNRGTDHGHGSFMMVLGGPIKGGKIYGAWPGLATDQLFEKRDLAVTTDYRDVLAELVSGHFGTQNIGDVFPGYRMEKKLGLLG